MALTDAKIRNLKPKERPYKIADFDGLYIHVTVKGSKLWRMKYRISGKEKLLAIGTYPAVSLLLARKARDDARTQIVSGVDPSQLKRENAFAHKVGPVSELCRSFKRVLCAKGERLWDRNAQQNLGRRRLELH